jgi:transposase
MLLGGDMPAPYSQDLRDRVIAAVAAGRSARAAAVWFGVSVSTAIRWAQRWRAEGHAAARAMGGDHSSRLTDHQEAVLALVARQPDLTLAEIRARLYAEQGVSVGLTTVWRFLETNKLTPKKRACMPPSKTVPMSPTLGAPSSGGNRRSTRAASSSSTRLAPPPT